jgi:hypothetical protein
MIPELDENELNELKRGWVSLSDLKNADQQKSRTVTLEFYETIKKYLVMEETIIYEKWVIPFVFNKALNNKDLPHANNIKLVNL